MGEISEMTLDGTLCRKCGVYIGDPTGYPRSCEYCKQRLKPVKKRKKKSTKPSI